MKVLDVILGKPISSADARAEQIGVSAGIPIFGLEALSSAAYGPEAALTLLIPLGAAASLYVLPIAGSIIALLVIVYFSYRQTIEAYPGGGGSYTVARQKFRNSFGLLPDSFRGPAQRFEACKPGSRKRRLEWPCRSSRSPRLATGSGRGFSF